MSDIKTLLQKVIAFSNDRDWHTFNQPKDVAMSLVIEASEVLEKLQWRQGEDLDSYIEKHKEEIADELGDVLHAFLLVCHTLDVDPVEAFENKLRKTAEKYPTEKVKGIPDKYSEL